MIEVKRQSKTDFVGQIPQALDLFAESFAPHAYNRWK